jgi:hypothetical protein
MKRLPPFHCLAKFQIKPKSCPTPNMSLTEYYCLEWMPIGKCGSCEWQKNCTHLIDLSCVELEKYMFDGVLIRKKRAVFQFRCIVLLYCDRQ